MFLGSDIRELHRLTDFLNIPSTFRFVKNGIDVTNSGWPNFLFIVLKPSLYFEPSAPKNVSAGI